MEKFLPEYPRHSILQVKKTIPVSFKNFQPAITKKILRTLQTTPKVNEKILKSFNMQNEAW